MISMKRLAAGAALSALMCAAGGAVHAQEISVGCGDTDEIDGEIEQFGELVIAAGLTWYWGG